jgi:hypothetical protein
MAKKKEGKLSGRNFNYDGADCTYNSESHCECYGCHDEGICRCRTIVDAKVTEIPKSDEIVSRLWPYADLIDLYCIERILSLNSIWDINAWEVEICGGYYGQEVDGIVFSNAAACDNLIETLLKLDKDSDKIEFVLNLEYGYILNCLKNLTWEAIEVPFDKLIFGQEDHYVKLNKDAMLVYGQWCLPRAICLEHDGMYKVADGYHRAASGGGNVMVYVGRKQ